MARNKKHIKNCMFLQETKGLKVSSDEIKQHVELNISMQNIHHRKGIKPKPVHKTYSLEFKWRAYYNYLKSVQDALSQICTAGTIQPNDTELITVNIMTVYYRVKASLSVLHGQRYDASGLTGGLPTHKTYVSIIKYKWIAHCIGLSCHTRFLLLCF